MTQTAYNLLVELAEMLYEDANTTNRTMVFKEADPVTRRDTEAKGRMHLLAARIMSDLLKHGGENIISILEEGAEKGITLYNCDMTENLHRIMPPP